MSRARNQKTGVTEQMERFACETVRLGRPSMAYRAAYNAESMTTDTVRKRAWDLMQDGTVAGRIDHYRAIAVGRLDASVDRIARETARIAFFDPRELFTEEGDPIPVHELPDDTARAIAGVDVEELFEGKGADRVLIGHVKKYKIAPKMDALRLLATWRKMLVTQVEHGKPGEFDHIDDQDELERIIKEKAVKLGLGRVLPFHRPKKKRTE